MAGDALIVRQGMGWGWGGVERGGLDGIGVRKVWVVRCIVVGVYRGLIGEGGCVCGFSSRLPWLLAWLM